MAAQNFPSLPVENFSSSTATFIRYFLKPLFFSYFPKCSVIVVVVAGDAKRVHN